MKLKLIIVYIFILIYFLTNKSYSKDTILVCQNGSSSVTLSFNQSSGKEHLGGDTAIVYRSTISDTSIFLDRRYEGKFVRSWNIDRYSGNGSLNWNDNGKIKTSYWNCRTGSKKF